MLTYAYFGLLRLTWAIGRSVGDSTGRIFAALVLGRARVGRMAVAAPGARTVDEVSLEVVAKRAAARDRKRLQRQRERDGTPKRGVGRPRLSASVGTPTQIKKRLAMRQCRQTGAAGSRAAAVPRARCCVCAKHTARL